MFILNHHIKQGVIMMTEISFIVDEIKSILDTHECYMRKADNKYLFTQTQPTHMVCHNHDGINTTTTYSMDYNLQTHEHDELENAQALTIINNANVVFQYNILGDISLMLNGKEYPATVRKFKINMKIHDKVVEGYSITLNNKYSQADIKKLINKYNVFRVFEAPVYASHLIQYAQSLV